MMFRYKQSSSFNAETFQFEQCPGQMFDFVQSKLNMTANLKLMAASEHFILSMFLSMGANAFRLWHVLP